MWDLLKQFIQTQQSKKRKDNYSNTFFIASTFNKHSSYSFSASLLNVIAAPAWILIYLLVELYNADVEVQVTGNYRLGDIRHNFADIKKIESLLSFTPQVDFKTGLKRFTDWVNEQQLQSSKYEDSINEMKAKGLLK